MERPRTPLTDAPDSIKGHFPTPVKAKVQGTIEYLRAQRITGQNENVFCFFGVCHTVGWKILREGNPRRHHNQPGVREQRGRKKIITDEQMKEMERIIETEGISGRALTWEQLGMEVGVEASGRTIQRAMGTLNYRKCLVCRKGWVDSGTVERRLAFAKLMLERYPEKNDWKHVRFSDGAFWMGTSTYAVYYTETRPAVLSRLHPA